LVRHPHDCTATNPPGDLLVLLSHITELYTTSFAVFKSAKRHASISHLVQDFLSSEKALTKTFKSNQAVVSF
jgi:hypothetical protein